MFAIVTVYRSSFPFFRMHGVLASAVFVLMAVAMFGLLSTSGTAQGHCSRSESMTTVGLALHHAAAASPAPAEDPSVVTSGGEPCPHCPPSRCSDHATCGGIGTALATSVALLPQPDHRAIAPAIQSVSRSLTSQPPTPPPQTIS